MTEDQALERLSAVKHLVVVMMENRSFDHMLGYLAMEGMPEVNGLTGQEFNLDPDGNRIGVTRFDADGTAVIKPGEALVKPLDPDHSKHGVQIQIDNGTMGGFVKAFVQSRNPPNCIGKDLWMVPMGYYGSKDLPTYDFLARNFCVCDAWHAAVPGDTWPNRLFAICGREGPKAPPHFLDELVRLFRHPDPLGNAPIYDIPAFTHQLDDHQWRWYSHDPATLRAADGFYRKPEGLKRENFAYFDRKKVSLITQVGEALIIDGHDSFLDDAAKGQLRDVSWIDPNFIDLSILDPASNDDHPPTDIRAGQAFVLEIYEALRRGPAWEDTVLVVVYDEHGGFYDHAPPPAVHDDTGYATLGVRVPALIVGPRAQKTVCHEVLSHTSLINTILRRFAKDPDRAIANMPSRVATSPHLGMLLEDAPRTDIPDPADPRQKLDAWRTRAIEARRAAAAGPSRSGDGAGQPLVLQDFQDEFARFVMALHDGKVLPHGQP